MWKQEKNIAIFSSFLAAIKDFELSLDENHEAVMKIISTGGPPLLSNCGQYIHPDLVQFEGIIDGQPAATLMHISQLNVTLISVPVTEERPKRTIGFKID